MINKKVLKKILANKQLQDQNSFFIVLSSSSKKHYLKISNVFYLDQTKTILAKQKTLTKSNIYLTKKTQTNDKILLYVSNNICFLENQLNNLPENVLIEKTFNSFNFFKKFYYILSLVSLNQNKK